MFEFIGFWVQTSNSPYNEMDLQTFVQAVTLLCWLRQLSGLSTGFTPDRMMDGLPGTSCVLFCRTQRMIAILGYHFKKTSKKRMVKGLYHMRLSAWFSSMMFDSHLNQPFLVCVSDQLVSSLQTIFQLTESLWGKVEHHSISTRLDLICHCFDSGRFKVKPRRPLYLH